MYKVIKDGEQIALIEKPVYIKCLGDGTFTPATEVDCQGIAVDSVPYNLFGCNSMDCVTETVMLCECDGGIEIENYIKSVDVSDQVNAHNTAADAHADIREAINNAANAVGTHNSATDSHADIRQAVSNAQTTASEALTSVNGLKTSTENWTFELEDGSTVTKKVVVLP